MLNKVLILSTIPAPYRTGVFDLLNEKYDTTVFFERLFDDNRNSEWFVKNDRYTLLDSKNSRGFYNKIVKGIKEYDLVLAYEYSTLKSMKLMIRCIINKVPYAINCDGAQLRPDLLKDCFKRFFIKRSAANLANGRSAKEYFLYYGSKEANIYFHNFSSLYDKDILTSTITAEEKSLIKDRIKIENKKIAIAVGRFIPLKRYDVLIKAWKKVNPEYKLIIIGGGEEKENYENLIRQNNLNNIMLVDYKNKEELKEYYKAADLFVHPTSSDVWGLVINEAMSYGLPVITTDKCVAGLELIKDNENGFIVPVGDIEKLAQKINIILNDDILQKKMANKNLEVIKPYTIENVAKNHIDTFERIFNRNGKRCNK